MSGLKSLLDDPSALLAKVRSKSPEPVLLRRRVAAMGEGGFDRPVEAVVELQTRVAEAVLSGSAAGISRRDLREACRVFFHPPSPPGRQAAVGGAIVEEVGRLNRRAAFFALIDVYLDAFDDGDEDLRRLAAELGSLSGRWPWREKDLWKERTRQFDLFNVDRAPKVISQAVMKSDYAPQAVLAAVGLATDSRRRGGLAEAAFEAACADVAATKGSRAIPLQDRLLAWSGAEEGKFEYPRAWAAFAAALFRPWTNEDPDPEHKRRLIDSAVAHAGDPRIREARWAPVKDEAGDALDVVVRWLTRASVEQFFEIVSQTMTDRPDMWAERRAFWTNYLRKDLISAAWVAFGADGAQRADRAAKLSADAGLSMFGRLESGGGRTSEHAALLMRIGDTTIVEWSHNGRWNIWPPGSTGAPKLFRHNTRRFPDYSPAELKGAPESGPHLGAWQYKVAGLIRHYTGLRP